MKDYFKSIFVMLLALTFFSSVNLLSMGDDPEESDEEFQTVEGDYPRAQYIAQKNNITDKRAIKFLQAVSDQDINKVKNYLKKPFMFNVYLHAYRIAERNGNQVIAQMITQRMKYVHRS